MRRWHAIPIAALVALLAGTAIISVDPPVASAGAPVVELSIDCDTSTIGIQSSCAASAGTLTVDIVLSNNTAGAISVNAVQIAVRASPEAVLNPPAIGSGFNANPDFNEAGPGSAGTWDCTTAGAPDNDVDPGSDAVSTLSCFELTASGPSLAAGGTMVLADIVYNTADGLASLSFEYDVLGITVVGDNGGGTIVQCDPLDPVGVCNGASVNIGAVAGTATPTNTPTETNTPTNTPTPSPTNTPCVSDCPPTPTNTPLDFDTVTPTPGGATPTAPAGGGETPVPGESPGPAPTQPGGGTGPGGVRPITLPDTGAGDASIDWNGLALTGLLALAVGAAAGGAYFVAVGARARSRRD